MGCKMISLAGVIALSLELNDSFITLLHCIVCIIPYRIILTPSGAGSGSIWHFSISSCFCSLRGSLLHGVAT